MNGKQLASTNSSSASPGSQLPTASRCGATPAHACGRHARAAGPPAHASNRTRAENRTRGELQPPHFPVCRVASSRDTPPQQAPRGVGFPILRGAAVRTDDAWGRSSGIRHSHHGAARIREVDALRRSRAIGIAAPQLVCSAEGHHRGRKRGALAQNQAVTPSKNRRLAATMMI